MTKPFLFVKPAVPPAGNQPGTAYDGENHTSYPYDLSSWEWLLERALRRKLLPWALTKPRAKELLAGHEDKYSMHLWGSFGESNAAGTVPGPARYPYTRTGSVPAANAGGYAGFKADADLDTAERTANLPHNWVPGYSDPSTRLTTVKHGVLDLERLVMGLLHGDTEWLGDAAPSWDLSASTTETTAGAYDDNAYYGTGGFVWDTEATHVPYHATGSGTAHEFPGSVPFLCLSHMRTDDPATTVTITNDAGVQIQVSTPPTPVASQRDANAANSSISTTAVYGGTVRVASGGPGGGGAALGAGAMYREFGVPYRAGTDYSRATGGAWAFDRTNLTSDTIIDSGTVSLSLGCLTSPPAADSGAVYIGTNAANADMFAPEVSWGGSPTLWHSLGSGMSLDTVASPKLREQLTALCHACQPAVPPAVPALRNGFPAAGVANVAWDYSTTHQGDVDQMCAGGWMAQFALAVTPSYLSSLMLDVMDTTVHEVPAVFAAFSREASWTATSNYGYYRTSTLSIAKSGTKIGPLPAGRVLGYADGGHPLTTMYQRRYERVNTINGASETTFVDADEQTQYAFSMEENCSYLVCLRSTGHSSTSVLTITTETLYGSTTSSSEGSAPSSAYPDDEDLLFPPWVLPWIKSISLYAAVESHCYDAYEGDTSETRDTIYDSSGDYTYNDSLTGGGTRTHKARWKLVKLCERSAASGETGLPSNGGGLLPGIDVGAVLSAIDPDPTMYPEVVNGSVYADGTTERGYGGDAGSTVYTDTTDYGDYEGSTVNETRTTLVEAGAHRARRFRRVKYYVAVKWNFDRRDAGIATFADALPQQS